MASMASAQKPAAQPGTPRVGLRERKKIQTRRAIRRAAYRLFEEQGYEATHADRIAEAADVSPSTLFRYFPTKEDIVLTDEYDALLEEGLRARPAGEPMTESLRHVAVDALRRLSAEERAALVQRVRLIQEVPAIRGRTAESTARHSAMISAVLAERTGRHPDDLEIRVVATAVLAALHEALTHWVAEDRRDDLGSVVGRAMGVLGRGLVL
ncbi:TetR family transcriptional regulator [Streptomyces sp. NPDC052496]|uniref:acyl-CoA-like ligand-binding transcription factor n=1 Tax=Streptomyces sp. NPDC052496 TaxID=3154951 RepID=UPI003447449D